jgi:hypothetical protein
MERFILDTAELIWDKEGRFIWKTASAEYDTDEDDEQQEEQSSHHNYLQLDIENWPVYLTEPYYSGDGHGPQKSESPCGYAKGELPVSYLPVIEDITILEHLNHDAALNVPSLDDGFWLQSKTKPPSLPLNIPEPEQDCTFLFADLRVFGFVQTIGVGVARYSSLIGY